MYSRYTEQNIAVNTSRPDAYLDAEAIGDIARQSPSLPMAREQEWRRCWCRQINVAAVIVVRFVPSEVTPPSSSRILIC